MNVDLKFETPEVQVMKHSCTQSHHVQPGRWYSGTTLESKSQLRSRSLQRKKKYSDRPQAAKNELSKSHNSMRKKRGQVTGRKNYFYRITLSNSSIYQSIIIKDIECALMIAGDVKKEGKLQSRFQCLQLLESLLESSENSFASFHLSSKECPHNQNRVLPADSVCQIFN